MNRNVARIRQLLCTAGEEGSKRPLFASHQHPTGMSPASTNPEAQPLLGSSDSPRTYHDEPLEGASQAARGSDEESNDTLVAEDTNSPKTRPWSTIAFQSIVVLLSLIVVGLFIKGFIDADDVEVWLCLEWCSRGGLLTGRPSLTWARPSSVLSVEDSVVPQVRNAFKRRTATHLFLSSYGPPGLDPHGEYR